MGAYKKHRIKWDCDYERPHGRQAGLTLRGGPPHNGVPSKLWRNGDQQCFNAYLRRQNKTWQSDRIGSDGSTWFLTAVSNLTTGPVTALQRA
jgi:hypothetical protein